MSWTADINWARLEDQLNALEKRNQGSKPDCPTLCQDQTDLWDTGAWINKSSNPSGRYAFAPTAVYATRRKDGTGRASNTESNRK